MTVMAKCYSCNDQHPLEDRHLGDEHLPVLCPVCESTSYSTYIDGDPDTRTQEERIVDAIADVDGVGDKTLEAILDRYSFFVELDAAGESELQEIPGVGMAVAQRIKEATFKARL